MLPFTSILTFFGKRDLIYLAIICALMVAGFLSKAHYESRIAKATQETADCRIEHANTHAKLVRSEQLLGIEKSNYTQCSKGMAGKDLWIESYVAGATASKSRCEEQLSACIKGKPSEVYNPKAGPKGVTYEDGKASDRRILDHVRAHSAGLRKAATVAGPSSAH